ncbi:MAG: hypothetical protein LBL74_07130 [Bacteroidales bacterium]|nr:hypothetical protein [Bacteroidales bacterium]
MKRQKLLFISAIFIIQTSFSQDIIKDSAADAKFNEIVALVDEGDYVIARTSILKALDEGADLFKYSYELAWCDYQLKDYKAAINVLKPLINEPKASADFYQLLGNAYDEIGQTGKATTTYENGLKRYPNAGRLYLELGNVSYKKADYRQALYYYEKGIEVEPDFASNYYRATKIYLSSTEEVWAVMFGEIFMNLEKDTERSKTISKDLFEVFKNEITLNRNDVEVDFYNPSIIYSDSYERKNLFPQYYKEAMTKACQGENFLNIASLSRIRTRFIRTLYNIMPDFHNVLFDYHKRMIELGFFEAYNYWLFGYGDNIESSAWISKNKKAFNDFLKWFNDNPLKIDRNNLFTRYNME